MTTTIAGGERQYILPLTPEQRVIAGRALAALGFSMTSDGRVRWNPPAGTTTYEPGGAYSHELGGSFMPPLSYHVHQPDFSDLLVEPVKDYTEPRR